jgi:hypothetical protein
MGSQEEGVNRKKDFQKRSDEDIDLFLGRRESSRTVAPEKDKDPKQAEATEKREPSPKKEISDEEHEDQIKAARMGRAQAEAYRDVALLRKKAHAFNHKAAKAFHKYKKNEAAAQKCSARAVAYREKAEARRDRAREYRLTEKEFEAELKGAATGKSDLSPESLRTKIAHMERKAAKQDEVAHKYEAKAASQTEKSAKFKTRAAKFLEQNKLDESEGRMYAKRADNLERAGP